MARGKTNTVPKPKFFVLIGHHGTPLPATALCIKHYTKRHYAPLQTRFDLTQWAQVTEGPCHPCIDELIEFEFSDSDYGEPESSI